MVITYAQMEALEDLAEKDPERVQIVKKAKVTRVLKDANGTVTGVEYEHQGQKRTVCVFLFLCLDHWIINSVRRRRRAQLSSQRADTPQTLTRKVFLTSTGPNLSTSVRLTFFGRIDDQLTLCLSYYQRRAQYW
jgi:hypothetical protein